METLAYAQVGSATSEGGALQAWRKSSHSNPDGACVEVARPYDDRVLFRDSKAVHGGVVGISRSAAAAFATALAQGEL
ncbi:DUF397 domain-containing protein [Streptomyces sp. NPDC006654]|uniref:DUF397 domain-containing protein n=1 Tax=Streptomyces sp. NPDC006654 TaxID=3156897 RepID=UPI0033C380E3